MTRTTTTVTTTTQEQVSTNVALYSALDNIDVADYNEQSLSIVLVLYKRTTVANNAVGKDLVMHGERAHLKRDFNDFPVLLRNDIEVWNGKEEEIVMGRHTKWRQVEIEADDSE